MADDAGRDPLEAAAALAAAIRGRLLLERSFGLDPSLAWKPGILRPPPPAGRPSPRAPAAPSTPARPAPRRPVPPPSPSPLPSPAPLAAAVPPAPAGEVDRRRGLLASAEEEVRSCRACPLCEGRSRTVFGAGDPGADLLFVGEAPGEEEDRQGEPFVGAAGQLLDRMIAAMGLSREKVYIANIVKCRPPGNRNPEPREIATCLPFLRRQIEAIRPRIICALGNVAAKTLLGTETGITRIRGTIGEHAGIPVLPTFHPSYLLRYPEEKKLAWADLRKVMEFLGLPDPRQTGERGGEPADRG